MLSHNQAHLCPSVFHQNGTDFNGDGKGDYSLCLNVVPKCNGGWILEQILVRANRHAAVWKPVSRTRSRLHGMADNSLGILQVAPYEGTW